MNIKTRRLGSLFTYACLSLSGWSVHSFEVVTHGVLTKEAWKRFEFADPTFYSRLGLVNFDDIFKTQIYLDFRAGSNEVPLQRGTYRDRKIDLDLVENPPVRVPSRSIPGWLIRGAIREDDDK